MTYWNAKFARTIERDVRNKIALETLGWRVLVVWECELKQLDGLRDKLKKFLNA